MSKSILSVFVDESGDFGPYDPKSPYYIVSMVFHDQRRDISHSISLYDAHLKRLGYENHLIHAGPLIRRESLYKNHSVQERKYLFNSLRGFIKRLPLNYLCVKVLKKECPDTLSLIHRLSKSIHSALQENADFFNGFDCIIVYYDNGQAPLTKILASVFNSLRPALECRTAMSKDYRLLQVADLICTMELLAEKAESGSFSKSETEFFGSPRNFRKNYLKHLRVKRV